MINLADFVEAHLTGIVVIEDTQRIELSFQASGSRRFALVAEGVDRFVVNEFRERNIVDRMSPWDSSSKPDDYRDSLAAMISGLNEGPIDAAWLPLIEKEIASIQRGEKVFVEIEPAYGAEVSLLARKVTLISAVADAAPLEKIPLRSRTPSSS